MEPMMSPQALKQMLALERSAESPHNAGTARFLARGRQPVLRGGSRLCGRCGLATCTEPYHVYSKFITTRDGSPFATKGSKFYYRCEKCCDFLCTRCLGIEDDYPCAPSQLERYIFHCPRCQGDVKIDRIDGVDMTGASEQMIQHPVATHGLLTAFRERCSQSSSRFLDRPADVVD